MKQTTLREDILAGIGLVIVFLAALALIGR